MPDATAARDATRAALDRKHDLAVLLEDALIILDGEASAPPSPDSPQWVARALASLKRALDACDELEAAVTAAFNETGKLIPGLQVTISRPGCPGVPGD